MFKQKRFSKTTARPLITMARDSLRKLTTLCSFIFMNVRETVEISTILRNAMIRITRGHS